MAKKKGSAELWRAASTQKALRSHFHDKIEGRTARGRDGVTPTAFEARLESEVKRLYAKLRSGEFRFSPYLLTLKLKGQGQRPREISIPTVRDRIVLRALAVTLANLHDSCRIELPQNKVRRVIHSLESNQYSHFLKLDIRDFYPSVKHEWLAQVLNRKVRSTQLRSLLMGAVTTASVPEGAPSLDSANAMGIPQGIAVSNALAELAVHHVDEAFGSMPGIRYFRYVDDVLVLMEKDHAQEVFDKAKELFQQAGLKIHEFSETEGAKSTYGAVNDGFEFLGYRFHSPRITVRASSFRKMEARIARIFTRHRYVLRQKPGSGSWIETSRRRLEWHLNLAITGCVFEGQRHGWLSYFSQIRHQQLLEHLDWLVQKQIARFRPGPLEIKTFQKSYRFASSKHPDTSGYVPNFDSMETAQKRELMVEIFGWSASAVASYSEEEANLRFARKIKRLTADMDRDSSSPY